MYLHTFICSAHLSENDGILPQIQEEIDMDEDELHFLEDEN